MPRLGPWFLFAAGIVAADQLTKWAVQAWLPHGRMIEITDFFNLVLVFNKGAAFSFLAGAPGWQTPLFVVIALVAAAVVGVLLIRYPDKKLLCSGLALILGGAIGNVIDRLRFGYVVDFLDFHAFGWHWPAFNVADSAITVGAGILIVESFLHREPGDARQA